MSSLFSHESGMSSLVEFLEQDNRNKREVMRGIKIFFFFFLLYLIIIANVFSLDELNNPYFMGFVHI